MSTCSFVLQSVSIISCYFCVIGHCPIRSFVGSEIRFTLPRSGNLNMLNFPVTGCCNICSGHKLTHTEMTRCPITSNCMLPSEADFAGCLCRARKIVVLSKLKSCLDNLGFSYELQD